MMRYPPPDTGHRAADHEARMTMQFPAPTHSGFSLNVMLIILITIAVFVTLYLYLPAPTKPKQAELSTPLATPEPPLEPTEP
ncbi:MAG TPA: hypothetical protein ENI80_11240 [Acidiferrobacteraceae bacterium]|nr:hypothetical protein [Acidiferrobacteraceae bacterium]